MTVLARMTKVPGFVPTRTLHCLSPGGLARVVLDHETYDGITRYNAGTLMKNRLSQYNGAMWVGAPLHERADVIRALRMMAEMEERR